MIISLILRNFEISFFQNVLLSLFSYVWFRNDVLKKSGYSLVYLFRFNSLSKYAKIFERFCSDQKFSDFKTKFEKWIKIFKAYLEIFLLDKIVITLFLSDLDAQLSFF